MPKSNQSRKRKSKQIVLRVSHIDAFADKKQILYDISYTFRKDSIYAIMGPNGSGKSTLAHVIMGNPSYRLSRKSKIVLKGKNITSYSPDKRSKAGIFMSYQAPISLSGVSVVDLLKQALNKNGEDREILLNQIHVYAEKLHIQDDLLSRSLHEGASGGERKKLELLQAAVLDRELMILDEIDTGVDVDALKDIASFIKAQKKRKTYILITHYNRILEYLSPDEVIVMNQGQIIHSDGPKLAERIEKEGYAALLK